MFLLVNSSGKFLTKGLSSALRHKLLYIVLMFFLSSYQDAVNAPKLRSGGSKSGASGKDFKGRNVKQVQAYGL